VGRWHSGRHCVFFSHTPDVFVKRIPSPERFVSKNGVALFVGEELLRHLLEDGTQSVLLLMIVRKLECNVKRSLELTPLSQEPEVCCELWECLVAAVDVVVVHFVLRFGYGLRIYHPISRASLFSSFRSFSGEGNKMHRSNKNHLRTRRDVQ